MREHARAAESVVWIKTGEKGSVSGGATRARGVVGAARKRGRDTHPTPRASATRAERSIRLGESRLCMVGPSGGRRARTSECRATRRSGRTARPVLWLQTLDRIDRSIRLRAVRSTADGRKVETGSTERSRRSRGPRTNARTKLREATSRSRFRGLAAPSRAEHGARSEPDLSRSRTRGGPRRFASTHRLARGTDLARTMWSRLSTTTLALALMALLVAPLASADDMDMPDTSKVTCGSTIKLQHAGTKARLHSHDISCVSAPAVPATRIAFDAFDATRSRRRSIRSADRSRPFSTPRPSSLTPRPPSRPSPAGTAAAAASSPSPVFPRRTTPTRTGR